MAGELTVKPEDLLTLTGGKQELDTLLKPLVREIHLFDSHIAGTSHLPDPAVLAAVQVGDKLTLRREENKFDEKAILVLNSRQEKLGYIPEKDNLIFSRLLDAGKLLTAQVSQIQARGTYTHIAIGIYLIDF